jgi:hypothetical protein
MITFTNSVLKAVGKGLDLRPLEEFQCLYNGSGTHLVSHLNILVNEDCDCDFDVGNDSRDYLRAKQRGLAKAQVVIQTVRDQALRNGTLVYMVTTRKELALLELTDEEIFSLAGTNESELEPLGERYGDRVVIRRKPSDHFYARLRERLQNDVKYRTMPNPGYKGAYKFQDKGPLVICINPDKKTEAEATEAIIKRFFTDPLSTSMTYRFIDTSTFSREYEEGGFIDYSTTTYEGTDLRVLTKIPTISEIDAWYDANRGSLSERRKVGEEKKAVADLLRPSIILPGVTPWRNKKGDLRSPSGEEVILLNELVYRLCDTLEDTRYKLSRLDQVAEF